MLRTDQCPYLDDAAATAVKLARDRGLEATVVELDSAEQIRKLSPSPYGVFTILLDGTVLSHYYQPAKKLTELLDAAMAS